MDTSATRDAFTMELSAMLTELAAAFPDCMQLCDVQEKMADAAAHIASPSPEMAEAIDKMINAYHASLVPLYPRIFADDVSAIADMDYAPFIAINLRDKLAECTEATRTGVFDKLKTLCAVANTRVMMSACPTSVVMQIMTGDMMTSGNLGDMMKRVTEALGIMTSDQQTNMLQAQAPIMPGLVASIPHLLKHMEKLTGSSLFPSK